MAIKCLDSKLVPLVVGTAVDILLLCGVLPYGVNLLGVNLCDSLDFNVRGVVIHLFDDVLVSPDAMSHHT